jgi:hypothetical protein
MPLSTDSIWHPIFDHLRSKRAAAELQALLMPFIIARENHTAPPPFNTVVSFARVPPSFS